jgi:peptide/nickel transport system permease protein
MTTEEQRPTTFEDEPEEERYLETRTDEANIAVASFWQLIWWRYRRHRVAVFCSFVVLVFYLIAAFSEFVAPYDPEAKFVKYKLHPPTPIHIVDADGNWRMPFIYQTVRERNPETFRNTYHPDTTIRHPFASSPRARSTSCGARLPPPRSCSA